MTSRRPFLLLRVSFPGRPIFIQLAPGVPISRRDVMCGLVHNTNGEQEVIAIEDGGFSYYNGSVEIFNVQSGQWRTGEFSIMRLSQ